MLPVKTMVVDGKELSDGCHDYRSLDESGPAIWKNRVEFVVGKKEKVERVSGESIHRKSLPKNFSYNSWGVGRMWSFCAFPATLHAGRMFPAAFIFAPDTATTRPGRRNKSIILFIISMLLLARSAISAAVGLAWAGLAA